jgi:hypothetical protein
LRRPASPAPRFALFDYTGNFAVWILLNGGPDLGTTVSGTVTEESMADGRAGVHAITHARNALTTVWGISESLPGSVIFGRSAADVADGAMGYALGENDRALPGQEPVEWRYTARAKGELRAAVGVPDGTRGRFMTSQTGLFRMPPHGEGVCFGFLHTFPVEIMFLEALGH